MPKVYSSQEERKVAAMARNLSKEVIFQKKQNKTSYKELEFRTGKSPSTICNALNKPESVSMETFMKLCAALGITLIVERTKK